MKTNLALKITAGIDKRMKLTHLLKRLEFENSIENWEEDHSSFCRETFQRKFIFLILK